MGIFPSSRINLTQKPQIYRKGGSLCPVISKHPCETFEFNPESRETRSAEIVAASRFQALRSFANPIRGLTGFQLNVLRKSTVSLSGGKVYQGETVRFAFRRIKVRCRRSCYYSAKCSIELCVAGRYFTELINHVTCNLFVGAQVAWKFEGNSKWKFRCAKMIK